MQTILTVLQVFLSLGLIGLVLIQHGRGADAGAAFGSGASATVFGARGSGSFLTRVTAILATLFFLTSMALAYYAAQSGRPEGLMDAVDGVAIKTLPRAPAETPAQSPVQAPVQSRASEVPVVPGSMPQPSASDVPVLAAPAPIEGDKGGSAATAEPKAVSQDQPAAPAPNPGSDSSK